jgi:hypothetical protein
MVGHLDSVRAVSYLLADLQSRADLVGYLAGVVGSGALTTVGGFWIGRRTKRRVKEREATGVDPRKTSETISLPIGADEALDVAKTLLAAQCLSYGTSVKVNREERKVSCRLGADCRTWGQMLTVDVRATGNDCQLTVQSWPAANGAATDWGRGKRTVASVIAQCQTMVRVNGSTG